MLNRAELLAAAGVGVKTRAATIDGVGEILLREFSGLDRDEYFTRLITAPKVSHNGEEIPNPAGLKTWAVSVAVRNPDGSPMFKDADDAGANLSPTAIDAIFDVIADENSLMDARRAEKN